MGGLGQDLRYGLRTMARAPGVTALAVLTLALGVGANTAIFSVVNAVLLRPLPYHDPGRLVHAPQNMSYPDMRDVAGQSRTLASIGGYTPRSLDLTQGAQPERVQAAMVTGDLFRTLGVVPQEGRLIDAGDDRGGGPRVVVITAELLRSRLGGIGGAPGGTISFSGNPYTIIGVTPPGFRLPVGTAEAFVPVTAEFPELAEARGAHTLRAVARLRPDATLAQTREDLDTIAVELERRYPEENTDVRYEIVPLHEMLTRDVRPALLLLLGVVGFVLLIACANVAHLLLARAASRRKEMAIRAALGAGRARIVRQLLTESLLIACAGGAAGLVAGAWLTDLLRAMSPGGIPRLEETAIDAVVLTFTIGLSALTALVFGTGPALALAARDLRVTLSETGRTSASPARGRLRAVIVSAEVAIALVLVIGSGLLIRSFAGLRGVDPGFTPAGLLTMNFDMPRTGYREVATRVLFFDQVMERIRALPGVTDVAVTTDLPCGDWLVPHNFVIDGRPGLTPGTEPSVFYRGVSPGYLRTMGIPLLGGRDLADADRAGAPKVAVINRTMARRFFEGQDPIGQRIRWARAGDSPWITIVGVAGDILPGGFDSDERAAVYVPFRQEESWWRSWMYVVVRSAGDPAGLAGAVRREVAAVDPLIPVAGIRTMEEILDRSLGQRRFGMVLVALFAGLALLLAVIGIYGVMSFLVSQRIHEMGVRLALGAAGRDLIALVLGQGMRLTAAGVAVGLPAAAGLTRLLRGMLFGVGPLDPGTYAVAVLLFFGVALAACWLPARRASRADPMAALRQE